MDDDFVQDTGNDWWEPRWMKLARLNDEEMRVAEAYIVQPHNRAQLSREINVSEVKIKDITERVHVKEYIEERFGEIRQASNLEKTWIISRLMREAEADGNLRGNSQSARITALKMLGQEVGMFTEKVESKVTGSHSIKAEVASQVQFLLPDNGRDPEMVEGRMAYNGSNEDSTEV